MPDHTPRQRGPAEAVPAATIILAREGPLSPEVLMLERHASSEFLPDLYVFPGGRVDPGDHDLADRVGGIEAQRATQLASSVDPAAALGFFVAAIRETFEESGVLLARRRGERELIEGALAAELSRHRLAIQEGETTLRALVEAEDLELAADALTVHGHWITPLPVPRRFDTLFFAAAAPADHEAAHDGVESSDHVWVRPEDALEEAARGERQMIFPTKCNLETVAGFASVADLLESSRKRPVTPILPTIEARGDERVLVIPGDAGYPTTEEKLDLPKR